METPVPTRKSMSEGGGGSALSSAAVDNMVWKIQTQFRAVREEDQLTLSVAPKKSKGAFSVYIPSKGTQRNKRAEAMFRKGGIEGLSREFGEFIVSQLTKVAKKWKKVEDMRAWADQRGEWKKQVRFLWARKCAAPTRSAARRLQLKSPAAVAAPSPVYSAKLSGTVTIPTPECFGFGGRSSIRVYPRAPRSVGKRTIKPCVMVWIPAPFRCEFSMGVKFADNPEWVTFVAEHLHYAVSKWKTEHDVKRWINQEYKNFREFLQVLYEVETNRIKTDPDYIAKGQTTRVWKLAPSTMKPDPAYIAAGQRDPHFQSFKTEDAGFGLFCTVAGKWTFEPTDPSPTSV